MDFKGKRSNELREMIKDNNLENRIIRKELKRRFGRVIMGEIRPEIIKFAEAMEIVMRVHDQKKGDSWKRMCNNDLRKLLQRETIEYFSTWHEMELVDIANFCMMLWTNTTKEMEGYSR